MEKGTIEFRKIKKVKVVKMVGCFTMSRKIRVNKLIQVGMIAQRW